MLSSLSILFFVLSVAGQHKYCLNDPYMAFQTDTLNQVLDHPENPDWVMVLGRNISLVDVQDVPVIVDSTSISGFAGSWLQNGEYLLAANDQDVFIVAVGNLSLVTSGSSSQTATYGAALRMITDSSEEIAYVYTKGNFILTYNITNLKVSFLQSYQTNLVLNLFGDWSTFLAYRNGIVYVASTSGLAAFDSSTGMVTSFPPQGFLTGVWISDDKTLLFESISEGTRVRNASNANVIATYPAKYPMLSIHSTQSVYFVSDATSDVVTISQINFSNPMSPLISYTGPMQGNFSKDWKLPVHISANVNSDATRIAIVSRDAYESRIYFLKNCGNYPPSSSIQTGVTMTSEQGTSGTTTFEEERESGSGNVGAIVGGVLAGILVVGGAIGGILLFAHFRRTRGNFEDAEISVSVIKTEKDERWDIPYPELKIQRKLGEGSFGVIYLAEWRNGPCVVKQLKSMTQQQTTSFVKEMDAMKNIRPHPNVCRLFGVCSDPEFPLCIVLEYLSEGAMLDYITSGRFKMTEISALRFSRDVASGMSHLHSEGIIHCDLAARNLMVAAVGQDLVVKISDFGLSRTDMDFQVEGSISNIHIPVRWTSPEVLAGSCYTRANDVWAFGVTIWEMCESTRPYFKLNNREVVEGVVDGSVRLPRPTAVEISQDFWDVMQMCWRSAEMRPTFDQLAFLLEKLASIK